MGYLEALTRCGASETPELADCAAHTLRSLAWAEWERDGREAAVAAYDQVIARFGDDPHLGDQVADALVSRGICLLTMGRSGHAERSFTDAVRRSDARGDGALLGHAAGALNAWGEWLDERRDAPARDAAQALLDRVAEAHSADFAGYVAWARQVLA